MKRIILLSIVTVALVGWAFSAIGKDAETGNVEKLEMPVLRGSEWNKGENMIDSETAIDGQLEDIKPEPTEYEPIDSGPIINVEHTTDDEGRITSIYITGTIEAPNGESVYFVVAVPSELFEIPWQDFNVEYTADDEGRITSIHISGTIETDWGESVNIDVTISFEYDENGYLVDMQVQWDLDGSLQEPDPPDAPGLPPEVDIADMIFAQYPDGSWYYEHEGEPLAFWAAFLDWDLEGTIADILLDLLGGDMDENNPAYLDGITVKYILGLLELQDE